jgi:hypothetical protein
MRECGVSVRGWYFNPQSENILRAIGQDTRGETDGLVSDGAFVADLHAAE